MNYRLFCQGFGSKNIYDLGKSFKGSSKSGDNLSFTNYYMCKNEKPFFVISGEFHYSRMSADRWEDELIKMKMCGINTVSTYVFWIHHEETEGQFDFTGCRDLRRFILLCQQLGLYVILRVGPFDHGEVRNGGFPDWLYGKPFESRTLDEEFLRYVKRLYTEIGRQTAGLYYQNDGPIIGVQIDNEYMHSAAGWEMTTGISNEWITVGEEGEAYMLRLRDMAAECGLMPVFYTCTGWGGAATPETMLPLWGGYAYRPWLFYSRKGAHPSTEEYVYQDFHNDSVTCTNDFQPSYKPETRPYACCEMGGGMMCSYYYRFELPYESVDAMANIKLGSGCNFLGYYMFQGGTNPVGRNGVYLNESQVPKISYDYQAALGEFGQLRPSYRRLKTIHYFLKAFGESFCELETVLPEGASEIRPDDEKTLRYAVRTDGKRGFLFVNNFQDHEQMPDRPQDTVTLELPGETVSFTFGIAGGENAILPFHMQLGNIDLVCATAQPVTMLTVDNRKTYVFMRPDGMQADFRFEAGVKINGVETDGYHGGENTKCERFSVEKDSERIDVLLISRELSNQMYQLQNETLMFTEAAVMQSASGLRLESDCAQTEVLTYPASYLTEDPAATFVENCSCLGAYRYCTEEKRIPVELHQRTFGRYTLTLSKDFSVGVKDVRLQIDYIGDIGQAFIDGVMIHDNFCNGATWEIGLKEVETKLRGKPLTLYIVPLKKNAMVNVESAMAGRLEEVEEKWAEVTSVQAKPVYEFWVTPPESR